MIKRLLVKHLNIKAEMIMEDELKYGLIRVSSLCRKIEITFPAQIDIHYGEMVVLENIARCCACPDECFKASDVQEKLQISKPAVSQTLNSLEKKGYVTRQINPHDRRKIAVGITETGYQVLVQSESYVNAILEEVLCRFGTSNMEVLIEQLNELADIFYQLKEQDKHN